MGVSRRWSHVVVAASLALLMLSGCGVRRALFGGSAPTRHGTLTVSPASGPAGSRFSLVAGGFRPGEPMTFEIDIPGQHPFVGPAHTAGADGTVTSAYQPLPADPPGTYQLKAVGSQGTRASATLTVTKP